ncbi:MAG: TonB family C-terminal domain protein [Acidobacteria bacterium]|nr:TonB family C-terminal domain protein [Acidobacteriota bacterium]
MSSRIRSYLLSAACLITLAATQTMVRAQGDDLQTFSPEGEEFSVAMPKAPKAEESQETYHRMTLNTRLYLSATDRGPVYAVASLSGIKANSALYTEFQRFNSYVDAFKNWFPQKVRGKDAVAKLTIVGDKVLNGNPGREYKVAVGDLTGTAHMYATRRRFYAVVILNTRKDDALTERFLSSLVLPEKVAPQPGNVAVVPPVRVETMKLGTDEKPDEIKKPDAATAGESKPGESTPPEKLPGERAPISGGVLNGKAVYLPQPEYPAIAAQAKAAGTVVVQVLIDEVGNVASAHAVSGHPLLQAAAVNAARQARFSPTSLMGEPVKVNGVITYNFVAR